MITRTALEEAGYILPPRTLMIMNAATAAKPAVANTDQRIGIARVRRADAATHRATMNSDVVVGPLGIHPRSSRGRTPESAAVPEHRIWLSTYHHTINYVCRTPRRDAPAPTRLTRDRGRVVRRRSTRESTAG